MASILLKLDTIINDQEMLAVAFDYLERKTGVKRKYLIYGILGLLVIYLVFGYAAQLISSLISFGYPAYASMGAIASPDKKDDTKWLIYWTVFGFLTIIEFPVNVLLSWVPFYWLAKSIFMIWLCLPSTNGAMYLYGFFEKSVPRVISIVEKAIHDLIKKGEVKESKKE